MGILAVIASGFAKIITKILEVILFLIQTLFSFVEKAISFPLFTDEETFRLKNLKFENTSNLDSIKSFSICFLTSVFLMVIGDILFNLFLIVYEILGVFPNAIANARVNLPSIGENTHNIFTGFNGMIIGIGDIVRLVFQIIVDLLHSLIQAIFVLVFICIIAELLFLVISVLLYALDLYILLRKNIYKLPNTETGKGLEVDSKDSLVLNFVAGLLVLPFASTLVVSIFLFLVGTIYEMTLSLWILPSGSRIAIPLMNQIIHLITSFFTLEHVSGQATRMLIGLFWMLIGLSSFRYQSQQGLFVEMKMVSSNFPGSPEEEYNYDEMFVKNYVLSFLLLFDPIISLSLIYYLRFVVIPF
ncbi:MAG: hypothetical protein ACXAC8_01945 [Candidatus Hodarchaeales archaeon]|jgi:hypothetical protein